MPIALSDKNSKESSRLEAMYSSAVGFVQQITINNKT
jgi:hypothetical protein